MNKNFKEKQRENILIKLISKYEQKINEEDKQIEELNNKIKFKKDVIHGFKINQAYWLGVIGLNWLLFPTLGYFTSDIIAGLIISLISSIGTGATLLLFKGYEIGLRKDLKKLNNYIDTKEKENEEYEEDIDKLKKHITPAHVEYNIKPNYADENNNDPYIKSFFVEKIEENNEEPTYIEDFELDSVCGMVAVFSNDEIDDTYSQSEGPTLVKKNKHKRK